MRNPGKYFDDAVVALHLLLLFLYLYTCKCILRLGQKFDLSLFLTVKKLSHLNKLHTTMASVQTPLVSQSLSQE